MNKQQTKQIFFLLNRFFLFIFLLILHSLHNTPVCLSLPLCRPAWIMNAAQVCVNVCIQCASMAKYGWKSSNNEKKKQLLLGSRKIPVAKMFENKANEQQHRRRHKKSHRRVRAKRKKSTSECGQFYLHCLPLCLITCSSLSSSLHSGPHALRARNLLHTHESKRRRNEQEKKKKQANTHNKPSREPFALLGKEEKEYEIFYAYVLRF